MCDSVLLLFGGYILKGDGVSFSTVIMSKFSPSFTRS